MVRAHSPTLNHSAPTPKKNPPHETAFDYRDAFLLEGQLTEEERLVKENANKYCQEKLFPRILMANRHEKFDREIMNEFGELGMLGCTINGYGYVEWSVWS
jgi:glutaryl-CoA dehydrogenase